MLTFLRRLVFALLVIIYIYLSVPSFSLAQTTVLPAIETGPSHHTGDTADDSAIWIHPTDPSLSIIIGDDKNGGMMVWDLSGTEIQYIDSAKRLNNVDIRYNFPLNGSFSNGTQHQHVALVTVGNENGGSLSFYKVNPATRKLESAGEYPLSISSPYGGCMYHSPVTNKYFYFVNWKTGVWQQVELTDAGNGNVTGLVVRTHDAGGQTEGCVADDVHKLYYLGEEKAGVWRYGAEPGDGTSRIQVDNTGSGGRLTADVEGISMYYKSDGTGYLIVSSQGNSTFQVYQRVSGGGANPFIGEFKVGANGAIDTTSGTDGLDVTNFPLNNTFPSGLLVVHDASNTGGSASNHKLVPFDRVVTALNLTIDTSWDPRMVGSGNNPPPTAIPPTVTSIPNQPSNTPPPTVTFSPNQPTDTPVPTQPPNNPCSTISSLSCFFQWVNEYIGIYLTKYADLNNDTIINLIDFEIWRRGQNTLPTSPVFTPTPTGISVLSPTPTQIFTLTPTPTQSMNPSPTPTQIIATPTTGIEPTIPPSQSSGIWTSTVELAGKPMSTAAWTSMKSAADGSLGAPELYNQDSHHPQNTLAVALVYARTGTASYRTKAADAIMSIIVTGPVTGGAQDGRSLALGRNLAAYAISADLIDLKTYDASKDSRFRTFLTSVRRWTNTEGRSLIQCHEIRPNNWGTMCGASRIAADIYLQDTADLNRAAQVFKGFLGDRASYAGFQFQSGALTWMCDSANPRPINPVGCIKNGHDLSGAQVDDVQRGGTYTWPPNPTNYSWGGFSATVAQAELLYRAGFDSYNWENQAVMRGMKFLVDNMLSSSSNPTDWMPWVVNFHYNTNFPAKTPTGFGRLLGWADWTHGQ